MLLCFLLIVFVFGIMTLFLVGIIESGDMDDQEKLEVVLEQEPEIKAEIQDSWIQDFKIEYRYEKTGTKCKRNLDKLSESEMTNFDSYNTVEVKGIKPDACADLCTASNKCPFY